MCIRAGLQSADLPVVRNAGQKRAQPDTKHKYSKPDANIHTRTRVQVT
jgi:hypothetical protein